MVAPDQVGIVGHSVGGYVALGMVGGWKEWSDPRIRVALLFSPYSLPFSIRGGLRAIRVPLMYQGADLDLGITTFLEGPEGAYAQSNAPKYFAKLRAGNHFIWTNLQCAGVPSVETCVEARPKRGASMPMALRSSTSTSRAAQSDAVAAQPALSAYVFDP